jgi:hypothetical protein
MSNFFTFPLVGVVMFLFSSFLFNDVNAAGLSNIGSGSPGLKVVTRPGNSNAIVIYHELPETPFGGSLGVWMTNETIQVIVDHGYRFQKAEMLSFNSGVPLQLYPFGPNSAFTDEVGVMGIMKPPVWLNGPAEVGFTLINSNVTKFSNVQEEAQMKYHLRKDEIFLGFIDGRVFFCKSDPAKVFWQEQGSQKEYCYHLSRSVVNVYGVTKALRPDKDVGFVAFRKTWHVFPDNLFLEPVEDVFIEISVSRGKLVRSEQ